MIADPSPENCVVVHSQRELAAAIRACPHDAPYEVVLERPSGGKTIFRFDYREGVLHSTRTNAGWVSRTIKRPEWYHIDARLTLLARRILKTPASAFK